MQMESSSSILKSFNVLNMDNRFFMWRKENQIELLWITAHNGKLLPV